MYEAGIAIILERKKYTIDGISKEYFECVDIATGFCAKFNNYPEITFKPLSGITKGTTITQKVNSNKKYEYCDFKTIEELTEENKNVCDVDKFLNEYKKSLGKCYTFNGESTFNLIKEQRILRAIGKKANEEDSKEIIDINKAYELVKEIIVGADEQIIKILVSIQKNQKLANSSLNNDVINKTKDNIFLYGETGTGKKEILKSIFNICNIPYIFADASSLAINGLNGKNIKDLLKDLYLISGKNKENAEKGIIVIEGFEKAIENKYDSRPGISNVSLQKEITNLLDGFTYNIDGEIFDTSKLQLVLVGEFKNLPHIKNNEEELTSILIKNYGVLPELIGKFSNFVETNPQTLNNLRDILLKSKLSPLKNYEELFKQQGIKLTYDDTFVDYVARLAIAMNMGADGLKIVLDKIINEFLFEIYTNDYNEINLTMPTSNNKPYTLTRNKN